MTLKNIRRLSEAKEEHYDRRHSRKPYRGKSRRKAWTKSLRQTERRAIEKEIEYRNWTPTSDEFTRKKEKPKNIKKAKSFSKVKEILNEIWQ